MMTTMTMTTTDGPDRGRRRSVIAPTAPLAEDLVTTDPQGTDPGPRPRLRLPARVRIMLWVASLTAGVLLLVVLVTWQSLLGGLDGRVDAALGQEIEEFEEYARMGIDPETGQSFTHTEALMRAYLTHQQPDDSEILFGHVDEAPGAQVPTGRVRQGPEPVYDASADNGLLRAILDDDAARGSVRTPEGEMHWEKLRVKAPDGSGHPDGWFVVGYFTAADLAELGATTRTVGLVGGVGLLFTGLAAGWVSGGILAPVRLVRRAAARISEEDLARRPYAPGNDAVAALAELFNGMLDRLQDAFVVQRRFIDDAGHELRTPITIVRGH